MKLIIMILSISILVNNKVEADTNTQKIQTLISEYESALNSSNTHDILKTYSKSPTFMPQHAPAKIGRTTVTQAYEKVFNTIKLNIKFTVHEVEVLGDTAWARTSSVGKTKILNNNMIIDESNNELFIFKKEEGDWKIDQYLFSTKQPRQ
ncbi:MAG: nuclear transport factor 2 family protein [Rhodobacteraceae bacterium]|nr:nuclear transport factor 2 family protein [Paracoccaceae bacterium]